MHSRHQYTFELPTSYSLFSCIRQNLPSQVKILLYPFFTITPFQKIFHYLIYPVSNLSKIQIQILCRYKNTIPIHFIFLIRLNRFLCLYIKKHTSNLLYPSSLSIYNACIVWLVVFSSTSLYQTEQVYAFLLVEILNFQGSARLICVEVLVKYF